MEAVDKKILSLINRSLPMDEQPFEKVAELLNISQEEVIRRIRALKDKGIIRRIGAVLSPRSLGWHSTLCAASIPEERIAEYASVVNSYPGVTHNYVRTGEPNCWFTLISQDASETRKIIREIEERLGITVLDLPATRTFKIKVSFDFT